MKIHPFKILILMWGCLSGGPIFAGTFETVGGDLSTIQRASPCAIEMSQISPISKIEILKQKVTPEDQEFLYSVDRKGPMDDFYINNAVSSLTNINKVLYAGKAFDNIFLETVDIENADKLSRYELLLTAFSIWKSLCNHYERFLPVGWGKLPVHDQVDYVLLAKMGNLFISSSQSTSVSYHLKNSNDVAKIVKEHNEGGLLKATIQTIANNIVDYSHELIKKAKEAKENPQLPVIASPVTVVKAKSRFKFWSYFNSLFSKDNGRTEPAGALLSLPPPASAKEPEMEPILSLDQILTLKPEIDLTSAASIEHFAFEIESGLGLIDAQIRELRKINETNRPKADLYNVVDSALKVSTDENINSPIILKAITHYQKQIKMEFEKIEAILFQIRKLLAAYEDHIRYLEIRKGETSGVILESINEKIEEIKTFKASLSQINPLLDSRIENLGQSRAVIINYLRTLSRESLENIAILVKPYSGGRVI